MKITAWVGSMSCAWIFCLLALASLPAVLTQAFHLHVFPSWLISVGLIALVAWIAQTFLQLVLLSIILVGSNVSAPRPATRGQRKLSRIATTPDRWTGWTSTPTAASRRLDAVERTRRAGGNGPAATGKRLANGRGRGAGKGDRRMANLAVTRST